MVINELFNHISEESDCETSYTSWKSNDDPAAGEFSMSVNTEGYPQVILRDGEKIKFRAGPWNGLSGSIERLLWVDSMQDWTLYLAPESDHCDRYAVCKAFGSCNIDNSPVCECLKGFEPISPEQWRIADWSQGCRRRIRLDCGPGEGFNKYTNVKLPDTRASWYNQTMTLGECEKVCKRNCSCTAYTNSNSSGTGSGCLLWFRDLIDIRTFAETGDTLYIRMPPSELGKSKQ
ncbi:hypothetical protein L1987_85062 [Smallanthus sonchifolius]|uniref:Uncharacterized protein n=1 Tax=Smallanthus sonchifolius TaxID=185202 RepID=A0ACB8XWB4_9ASTR|nr:hypothetical protein L1987_85062 [Smallanthus sonchifolius]